jgi:hypothetical protein
MYPVRMLRIRNGFLGPSALSGSLRAEPSRVSRKKPAIPADLNPNLYVGQSASGTGGPVTAMVLDL